MSDKIAKKEDDFETTLESSAPAGDGNINDLTSLIQGVLQQTQDRFQHMSDQIIRRIDDMTQRIDDLEKNISDLLQTNQVTPIQSESSGVN